MNIQVCRDTSDAVALYLPQRLFIKSFAKLNISVQLPPHKVHGKSISNWELMEKLRKMILPDSFSVLKVSKHSSEVIKFEAELENRDRLERVLSRLADRLVVLSDYPDPLKVNVSEAKSDFPTRHAWDSFYRDATDMDEMKPGERPDTIHVSNLPIRWFIHSREVDYDAPPSESIFKRVFEKFGSVRQVDVPAADPFRLQMKSSMRGITISAQESSLYFEGYVQYNEYVSFVRCMDALRGRKLLHKGDDVSEWCGIKVDFDKTKHMTDAAVKRRAIVRERLASLQNAKDQQEHQEKEVLARKEAKQRQKEQQVEREKLEKMREREERRKKKQLAKLLERDDIDPNVKVSEEREKLMKAQKKLQAIRLIEELFKRIELRPELQWALNHHYCGPGDHNTSTRVVDIYKQKQEAILAEQQQRFRCAVTGRMVIRSALETQKLKRDSSASSSDSDLKRVKAEKVTSPEREEYNKTTGLYGMPYGFGYPFPVHSPYPYPQQAYFPIRSAYYPAPESYAQRRPRGRGRGRGRGFRVPYFEGPDANLQYYRYFKKLTESENRSEHEDRRRYRSYSRSHSRSRSRSRSRSKRRSRSRSRSRRSRSRSRRSRSRRSQRKQSRSHSRKRSRSRSYRSKSREEPRVKSRSKSRSKTPTDSSKKINSPSKRSRSKSWSLPKEEN